MIAVGIDPGLTGALAFVDSRGSVAIEDMPTVALPGNGMIGRRVDGLALAHLVRRYVPAGNAALVLLEEVGAMGGKNNAVQTQVSLGRTLGAIEAVLEVLRLPPRMVKPRTWKAHYGLDKRREDEKEAAYKGRHLATARALYPAAPLALAKHHNRAEALLLAHWGKDALA